MIQQDREELISLKVDVEHIKGDVKETKEVVDKFYKSIVKIESKLFNDNNTGEEGYISLAKRNSVKINKLENVKKAGLSLLFFIGGVVGWLAKQILSR